MRETFQFSWLTIVWAKCSSNNMNVQHPNVKMWMRAVNRQPWFPRGGLVETVWMMPNWISQMHCSAHECEFHDSICCTFFTKKNMIFPHLNLIICETQFKHWFLPSNVRFSRKPHQTLILHAKFMDFMNFQFSPHDPTLAPQKCWHWIFWKLSLSKIWILTF